MGERLNRSVPDRGLCHRFDIRPLPADALISFPAGSTLFSHSFNGLELVCKFGFLSKKYSSRRFPCRTIRRGCSRIKCLCQISFLTSVLPRKHDCFLFIFLINNKSLYSGS